MIGKAFAYLTMGFYRTPVFAGWTALTLLDFRGLGDEDTRYLRDSGSVLRPKCPVRGIRACAASAQRDFDHAPRRLDLRWLSK